MKNKKFDFMISKSKEKNNKLIPVIFSCSLLSSEFISDYEIEGDYDSDLHSFVIYFGFIPLLHLDNDVHYNSGWYTREYGIPFFKSKKINNEQNNLLTYNSYHSDKKQKSIFSDSSHDLYGDKNININRNFVYNYRKIVRYNVSDMYHVFIQTKLNNDSQEEYDFGCEVEVPNNFHHMVYFILKHINCDFSKIIDFIRYYIETSDSDYKKFFKDYKINNNGMIKYMKIYCFYKTKIKYKIIRLDLLEMLFNKIINYNEFSYHYPNYDDGMGLKNEK